MSALTCRDFFAWNAGNSDLVKELQKHPSDVLSWEANTASDHSPGPVEQDETLFRQIVQPLHIDMETKTLRPNAFNDVANKGLSVDRAKHSSVAEIISSGRQRVAARAASDGRALYALAEFRSLDLRLIVDESGRRSFAIYDTAACDNIAHADVCQLVEGKQSGRSARSKLLDAVVALKDA